MSRSNLNKGNRFAWNMLPSHKKSEDEVLVMSGIILIIKFEVNVFSQLMAEADNSY